jgi:hypothetical protein
MALIGALLSGRSFAATLADIPGPTFGYFAFGNAALANSWTQTFGVTDGSISVDVQGLQSSGGPVNFYLTTAIGPTATLSDLIAATSIQVPFALTTVTPFTNLNLGAGSYYLIMAGYNTGENGIFGPDWNYYNGNSGVQTIAGLTLNPLLYSTSALGMYAPATTFQTANYPQYGVMSYTGTVVPNTTAQAPEIDPSLTMSALTFLVGALAVLRRPARRAKLSF